MKKAMCIAAAILILSLAGCAETAGSAPSESSATPVVNGETSQESTTARETAAHSFSGSKEMPSTPETETATEEPTEESKPDPGTSTEAPAETEKLQETPATPPKAAETPQPEKPESRSAEPAEPKPSEPPRETQPPADPEPETTPEPMPEQPPEETQPKSAYDYEFDIEAIKADCIAIGQGMGLSLDSSLTPNSATWWNPVTASQSNQGTALKQSLESYITFHTAANLSAYGMDAITSFNIYCEARGNGVYSIYFLFA